MTVESSNSMGYSGGETRRLKISKPRVDDNDSGYAHAHRFCCVTNFSSCCATKTVMIFFFHVSKKIKQTAQSSRVPRGFRCRGPKIGAATTRAVQSVTRLGGSKPTYCSVKTRNRRVSHGA